MSTRVYFFFRGEEDGRNHKRLAAACRNFNVTPDIKAWSNTTRASATYGYATLPTPADAQCFIAAVRAVPNLWARLDDDDNETVAEAFARLDAEQPMAEVIAFPAKGAA